MGQGSSSTSCSCCPFRSCEGSKRTKRLKKHSRAEREASRCTSASDVLEASDSSDHEVPGSSAGTAKHKKETEPHLVPQSSEEVIELTLKSDEEPERAERPVSCFSRAARRIRNVPVRSRSSDVAGLRKDFGQLSLEIRGIPHRRPSEEVAYCGLSDYRPTDFNCPDTPSFLSQFIIPFPTAHSYLQSVNDDTEEHPVAMSLHEVLEPATRLKLSSPMEADSRLRSSTTDSCKRKEVSRSSSFPSSPKRSAKSRGLKRAASLPDMKLKSSFEEFSPDCTDEFDGESYRFQCSCPGLYQCRETGLVFDMKEGGQVLYRILTWNRRQLRPHHKKPAGPLFDIKCLKEGSMSQLHLPHCEIRSTGGCGFLSVAHVKDDAIEFIRPEKITETHVIIKVTGFSGFGNVKDVDSPSVPIRALVLLFYKPPLDPDHEYCISVLLLPRNVSLRHVQKTRKELYGDETFIETPPHCKLCPRQVYSLTTSPGGDSVEVQPSEGEFDEDYDDNYFPTFCVTYERMMKHIKLVLEDSSSTSVWKRQVRLPSSGVKRSCGSASLNLPPNQHLLEVRSSFINGISESNLKSLLDKLLEKHVITDSEKESAEERGNRGDRARVVLDTVRRKGDAASSEMMEILRELDPFLCRDLDLN